MFGKILCAFTMFLMTAVQLNGQDRFEFSLKQSEIKIQDRGGRNVISHELERLLPSSAENEIFPIWVFFRDKGINDQDELDKALEERKKQLSSRVLWRRSKTLGEETILPGDLPLCKRYIGEVLTTGCSLRHKSKWLNAISVEATPAMILEIASLPSVRRIQRVASMGMIDPLTPSVGVKSDEDGRFLPAMRLDYGPSFGQLEQINVPAVHDSGFSANGVIVMMLDTGFYKEHEALETRDILAEWDFVFNDGETQNEPEDVSNQHDHGTTTWSVLGGFSPGNLIGPAYNASFLLAKTEDLRSETPAEEDNYVAALEWGDSLGVDVASASLAYLLFDDPIYNYSYSDLDGNTAVISVAIDEAAWRGILVCNAMGNSGPGSGSLWTPADADSMIACGAVESTGEIAGFSSRGPTFDERIKPEVVARGVNTYGASARGGYYYAGGTSLSTPLVGGSAALVLEAHPEWGPMEIREALMSTASQTTNPDNAYGSGLIDVWSSIYEDGVEMTPLPFSLSSPANQDTVTRSNIDFSWTVSVDPIGRELWYKLMIDTDSLFNEPIVIWDISNNYHTYSDTLMEGLHFWRVFSYNNQGYYRQSEETFTFFATDSMPTSMISIAVIPDSTVFQRGGELGFSVSITNNTMDPLTVDGWTDVTLPGGRFISPEAGPVELTIGSGNTLDRYIVRPIPSGAPLGGPYAYCVNVGTFPGLILAFDCFEFEVVEGAD